MHEFVTPLRLNLQLSPPVNALCTAPRIYHKYFICTTLHIFCQIPQLQNNACLLGRFASISAVSERSRFSNGFLRLEVLRGSKPSSVEYFCALRNALLLCRQTGRVVAPLLYNATYATRESRLFVEVISPQINTHLNTHATSSVASSCAYCAVNYLGVAAFLLGTQVA